MLSQQIVWVIVGNPSLSVINRPVSLSLGLRQTPQSSDIIDVSLTSVKGVSE